PLRDYQFRSIQEAVSYLDQNPIIVLPTGAGKTYTASVLIKRLVRPALWVAHRQELIMQAERQLRGLGLNTGIIMAGQDREPEIGLFANDSPPVWVASVQTLARRKMPEVGLVVIDECHHATSNQYQRIFEHYFPLNVPILGLTATP